MELTLYTADCTGKAANCLYPHEKKITNQKELVEAIAHDYVFAKYKDSYRSIENFISSSVIPLDCDNNHTEKPEEWLTSDKLTEIFDDMQFVLIPSRNNTMSHFAGRVLKKFCITDKAHQLYMERAEKCESPLSKAELDTIWKSAVKFANKIQAQDGYISSEKFNDEFGAGSLKPEDYSDIGEAKVLSRENMDCLRFTNATGFLTYCGDRWHENTQKALGITENFLDIQLADADEAIKSAEDALVAAGVPEESVRAGGKTLEKAVPAAKMGLLYALIGAQTYHKFVMKYRNYKNIVNTQNAAKPMLAIDVSELDYDAELLNTPEQTYNLTKGMAGGHTHAPDDLKGDELLSGR